jgi:hypothetical protein
VKGIAVTFQACVMRLFKRLLELYIFFPLLHCNPVESSAKPPEILTVPDQDPLP